MNFEAPDAAKFPCLRLAREAIRAGGTLPAVLNAANESAVAHFLEGQIGLLDIAASIEAAMDAHDRVESPTLDQIFEADRWARREVEERCSART
jgi:1-deoxy-D-xylulose-5-phosphate reductoisomerase